MPDNVSIRDSNGNPFTVLADQVTDATLGTGDVQFLKIMDGTLDSTNKLIVDGSGRAAVAMADGASVTTGAQADAAWGGSGAGSLVALLKAVWTRLRGGQATMAASLPVAIASDQSTLTVQGLQGALQSGAITAVTSVAGPWAVAGYNLATVGITGTYAGVSAVFEGSPDGSNWFALQGQRSDSGVAETGPAALTNTTRAWDVFVGAWTQFRVRATAWTSGSATVLATFQSMPTEPVPTAVQGPAGTAPWLVHPSDGTNSVVLRAASTPAAAADVAEVVTQRPVSSGTPQVTTASTNAASIKAAAGVYYGVIAVNTTATIAYLKVFNKASAATLGTDVPIFNIPIPANTAGAGFAFVLPMGRDMPLGIQVNVTGGNANLDTSSAVAGVVLNHLFL